MKNLTSKKVIGLGLGITVGFLIIELFNDPINWIKPIVTGIIATALLFGLKLIFANRNSNKG
ncbi:hypothetical protein [uncultured Croceitalea sp.]|uniref:hypothetical protein n=1 Tax=uncultured Croceitalea sp. TaxID=1798908 RepID=UPI003305D261